MALSELSKICICMVTLLSLAIQTMPSQVESQPSFTNDTMPTDDELISLAAAASSPSASPYPETPTPESGGYLVSPSNSEYNPPPAPPQPYIDTFSPQSEDDNQLLSPDYSPSPSPYFQEYSGSDQITENPSPPPYIEVEAPESFYESYSPIQAPAPAPTSEFGSNSEFPDTYSPNLVPRPSVLPSNYKAENESAEYYEGDFDVSCPSPNVFMPSNYKAEDENAEYYEGDFDDSDQNKNRKTMVGFVLGAVCVVGLAGFVYKKKKYRKSKSEYEYELAKREDL